LLYISYRYRILLPPDPVAPLSSRLLDEVRTVRSTWIRVTAQHSSLFCPLCCLLLGGEFRLLLIIVEPSKAIPTTRSIDLLVGWKFVFSGNFNHTLVTSQPDSGCRFGLFALFSEAARPNLGTRHRRANYSPLRTGCSDNRNFTLVGTTHARLSVLIPSYH